MKIELLKMTRAQLSAIPKQEQLLLFHLSHLGNKISVLERFAYYTGKQSSKPAVQHAYTTMGSLVIRFLAGTLFEGWTMLQPTFFKSKLSKEYFPSLSDDGRASLKRLQKYFGADNVIKTVRNKFAFHTDNDVIVAQLDKEATDAEYHFYLMPTRMNSLFYAAEEVMGMAMLHECRNVTGCKTVEEVHQKLYEDVFHISRNFAVFIEDCVGAILTKYVGHADAFERESVEVGNPVRVDRVAVPYFIARPSRMTTNRLFRWFRRLRHHA